MPGGFRQASPYYEPEGDPELLAASARYEMDQPMAPPPLPEMDGTAPAMAQTPSMLQEWMNAPPYQTSIMDRLTTPLPWEERAVDAVFGRSASQAPSRPQLPILPGETPEAVADQERRFQSYRAMDAKMNGPVGKPMRESAPSTRGPMVAGKASDASPRKGGVGTQRAIYFARAMGISPPGEPDSPEEMAFVKAANAAMAKLGRGMSATKVFSMMSDPKTAERFKQLLDAEMAKGAKPSPKTSAPATGASR